MAIDANQLEGALKDLGAALDEILPDKVGVSEQVGFVLMAFDFGDRGSLAYVSNAQRADVVAAVREWLEIVDPSPLRRVNNPSGKQQTNDRRQEPADQPDRSDHRGDPGPRTGGSAAPIEHPEAQAPVQGTSVTTTLTCPSHRTRVWKGHVICAECGQTYQTSVEGAARFAPAICRCGRTLMPPQSDGGTLIGKFSVSGPDKDIMVAKVLTTSPSGDIISVESSGSTWTARAICDRCFQRVARNWQGKLPLKMLPRRR